MKKILLFVVPLLTIITAIPAFCAANMNDTKLEDSIRDCKYFKTSSFIDRSGQRVKYVEKVQGYVNGKCRYITESHYPNGMANGMICDLNDSQRKSLADAKGNKENKTGDKIYVPCESYDLVNNEWIKNKEGTTLGISR